MTWDYLVEQVTITPADRVRLGELGAFDVAIGRLREAYREAIDTDEAVAGSVVAINLWARLLTPGGPDRYDTDRADST